MLPSCAAILGISPVGQLIPFTVVGLKEAGVTPEMTLRSKVSMWLGAPASRIKIVFLALFWVATPALVTSAARRYRLARNEAVTPAPAMRKNSRRVQWGRSKNGRLGCGYLEIH